MISMRHAPEAVENSDLVETQALDGESNRAWLRRVRQRQPGLALLLLGGNSTCDFRIRVAQSRLRSDLLPSFWSLAGILLEGNSETFVSVPLDLSGEGAEIAEHNGVRTCSVGDYDDPTRYPNIAILYFARDGSRLSEYVQSIQSERSIVDLTTLMVPWLGFIWGTEAGSNPLLAGHGLPSAVFVQTVYAIAGIDLAPGLSSATTCPEAIWQSSKWWCRYYEAGVGEKLEGQAERIVPSGAYLLRQPAAAAVGLKDRSLVRAPRLRLKVKRSTASLPSRKVRRRR